MDDILVRLVGDIWDETDEIIKEFVDLDEDRYKVLGTANIDDLFAYIGIKAESSSNTVGGWIMDTLRHIPKTGDSFVAENLKVTVTGADERKVIECIVEVIK
jgi:CBS domain containing-hemolysin-like protein